MTTFQDVEKLFTPADIACMKKNGIDLSNCANVAGRHADILARVSLAPGDPKRMPQESSGEAAWTPAQIAVFQSWIDAGRHC